MKDILIAIPTYNEVENVDLIYKRIRINKIRADILFIDDSSKDGTSKVIKKILRKDKSVFLISRKRKLGIGSAHQEAINFAYLKKYKKLITMDCDFTHKPEDIKKFLEKERTGNVIVGSRYISKGSLSEWNIIRKFLTLMAHFSTTNLLKMPYDATSAFRLYDLEKIPKDIFLKVESNSYSFFFESMFILHVNKFKIKEVSIELPARTYGSSKMTFKDIYSSLILLLKTFYLYKTYKDLFIYTPQILFPSKSKTKVEDEWDDYWKFQRKNRKILYDTIAIFYRKYIIRQNLNRHIRVNFKKNANVLHAGSGGGQVDADIVKYINITGLDISTGALNLYKRLYGDSCQIIHGSIFNIPVKREGFDGIYNLGVMEHFTEKEIVKILKEFNRVLKKDGKIILFWPPAFGISVLFLNSMHFILNNILDKKIRLHPEEITKVKSRKQIKDLLSKSGFELKKFNFGPWDLFTYVVIVAKKK